LKPIRNLKPVNVCFDRFPKISVTILPQYVAFKYIFDIFL